MRNLLFTISYCGSAYHGWQVQDNAVTVQEKIQDAVEAVLQRRENIIGCSRTDSGVHANEYCFNMRTETLIDCDNLVRALNANLPFDTAVKSCKEVPLDFHARYNCVSKEYKYLILNSAVRNPFLVNRVLLYPYNINVGIINQQAKAFIGKYDFSAFCAAGSSVESNVRQVIDASAERKGDMIEMTFSADGFLYNMVRIMVGTLLDISSGKIEKDSIKEIIMSKDRSQAGFTACAEGLYLNKVNY